MTMARRLLVDVDVTRYYHCISRCVRRAFLCGDGFEHRKAWIEARLEVLANQFAVSVCGFAIMDNHLHVLFRLDPGIADDWSGDDVVRRWIAVYPPANLDLDDPRTVQAWINDQCSDASRVAKYRERLQNRGWFMKALKEPLARMANKEDHCKGTFWEARYKSIAILEEEALPATCAYIDLNPVAAGIAATPEASEHTSIKQRIDHARRTGAIQRIQRAGEAASVAGWLIEGDIEQSHWLCPMQDRRRQGACREGLFPCFSLSGYLELVEWTARIYRTGKATMSQELARIMERLGTTAECWQARMKQLLAKSRWLDSFCATSPKQLKAIARRRGLHHADNAIAMAAVG